MVDGVPSGWEIWLDGTHNPHGARALAEAVRDWPKRQLYLIFGTIKTHPPGEILAELKSVVTALRGVSIPDVACHTGEEIAKQARALGIEAEAAPGLNEAVQSLKARHGAGGPARLLICGSLYLAGAVLRENG